MKVNSTGDADKLWEFEFTTQKFCNASIKLYKSGLRKKTHNVTMISEDQTSRKFCERLNTYDCFKI